MDAFDASEFRNRVRHMSVTPDGITFNLIGGETACWKNRHFDERLFPPTSTDSFIGRIRCGCCGSANLRVNDCNRQIRWYCSASRRKTNACMASHLSDYAIRQITAGIMGTDDLDEAAFLEQVDHITAEIDGTISLHYKDGRTARWQGA